MNSNHRYELQPSLDPERQGQEVIWAGCSVLCTLPLKINDEWAAATSYMSLESLARVLDTRTQAARCGILISFWPL